MLFRMAKRLQDRDIETILSALENGDISEDEECIGDENEIDNYPNVQDQLRELEDEVEEELNEIDPELAVEEDHLPDEFQG